MIESGANRAFQLLGVGLFARAADARAAHVAGAVLLLIGVALLLKGVAATLLIRPASGVWAAPGVAMGIAAGALLIPAAIRLPRPVQVAACAVALLSSMAADAGARSAVRPRAAHLFNWRYGHLLNYNGLTHTVLLVWPILAAPWLFALAGRPAWGEPPIASSGVRLIIGRDELLRTPRVLLLQQARSAGRNAARTPARPKCSKYAKDRVKALGLSGKARCASTRRAASIAARKARCSSCIRKTSGTRTSTARTSTRSSIAHVVERRDRRAAGDLTLAPMRAIAATRLTPSKTAADRCRARRRDRAS